MPKEILYVLFGITIGVMSVKSPYLAWLIPLGLLTILLLSKSPLHALFVFVIFIPFSSTELFNTYIIDLPGARLINILGFLVLAGGIWHYKDSVKLSNYAFFFITAIFFIFTIAVFRSLSHLDQLIELADDIRSTSGYLLSHFVKPLLFFIPLIVIIKFCKETKHLEFVTNVLTLSLITLSLYLLFLFLFKAPDKNELARDYMTSILKLHGNDISNFFIIDKHAKYRIGDRSDRHPLLENGLSHIASVVHIVPFPFKKGQISSDSFGRCDCSFFYCFHQRKGKSNSRF